MSLFVLHFYCVSRPPISEKNKLSGRLVSFMSKNHRPSAVLVLVFFLSARIPKVNFYYYLSLLKRNISGDEGISLQVLSVRQAETDVCRMPKLCGIPKGF
ncbi:unnamed protein product [Boreogadus saida]